MNEFLQKSATNCSSWNKRQLIIDTKEKEIFMISSTKYLIFKREEINYFIGNNIPEQLGNIFTHSRKNIFPKLLLLLFVAAGCL
ncbi:hypothetical protein BDL97_01G111600 [Sphagnum fallax]|nr:hypothetical protein BDL97_01G111600 [Sphagnum fallax]